MNWILQHSVELLALVGAIYGLARMIVALTPTPKDDAQLEKVASWLKAIAKVVGLDLKQGLRK